MYMEEQIIRTKPVRFAVYHLRNRNSMISKDFTHTWALALSNYLPLRTYPCLVSVFHSHSVFIAVSLCGVSGLIDTSPFRPVHSSLLFQAFMSFLTVPFPFNLGLLLTRFHYIFISASLLSISSLLFPLSNHFNLLMIIVIGSNFASPKTS